MKIQNFLLPFALALVTTWVIQYFFFGRTFLDQQPDQMRAGQQFTAAKDADINKPLNFEVDFLDAPSRPGRRGQETLVETDYARYEFSNDGAVLQLLEFKRLVDGKAGIIETIFPLPSEQREQGCFLLAFNEKTPYYYDLVEHKELDETIELVYRASFDGGLIFKRYIIFKNSFKLDLEISLEPQKSLVQPIDLRLFYPSPVMPEIAGHDVIHGLADKENKPGVIERKTLDQLRSHDGGWVNPSIFGSENRYFVHTLVNAPQEIARRAYFDVQLENGTKLISILESKSLESKGSWRLSFYFGPKDLQALNEVDPRLEQTLDYGWFAPVSKFFLALLKFLYKYLHNYGLAIIVLTLLIKLLLLPFSFKTEQEMKKKVEFQKKLNYLQKKYKHDSQRLAQERAELLRKHGMPGLGGCLQIFLQLPVFIALRHVLTSSIELYKAQFLIWDLSARDPYYIFPVLIALSLLVHAFTMPGDIKQRLPFFAIALVLPAILANMSVGMCLFIVVNGVAGVIQTKVQKRFRLC